MTNKDLFKEAIADAKQVREAALANAKVALEEALTPRLQSMLSTKLQEMEEDEVKEGYDKEEDMEEGFDTNDFGHGEEDAVLEGDEDLEEDFDLSAILAELDEEEKMEEAKDSEKEELEEAKEEEGEKMEEAKEEGEEEEAEESEEEEAGEEEAGEEAEDDEKVKDITVDQLKDIIKDIVAAELGGAEEMSMDAGEEEMIDLGGEEEVAGEEEEMMEEINLEELLAELDALEETEQVEEAKEEIEEAKEEDELKEAIETINTLRAELQEVNLLNAKLLYVNKIFKAKNLTESQKVKVIASFDKATTAKEAKIIFESLESTLTATSGKSQIKESLGFASKAAGVAPKKQIVEVNDNISRMQQSAGIVK